MTGLTRKEVRKQREILAGGQSPVSERTSHANRASRVVSGWVHDETYQAANGQPAVLAFEAPGASVSWFENTVAI